MIKNNEVSSERIEIETARLLSDVVHVLSEAVAASGLTQRELAERLGLSESRISQVLSGDGNVRISTLGRFLAACGRRASLGSFVPEQRGRRRRKESGPAVTRSFAVYEHTVVSKDGIHPAIVLAPGVEHPGDVFHLTRGLLAESLEEESARAVEAHVAPMLGQEPSWNFQFQDAVQGGTAVGKFNLNEEATVASSYS